MELKQINSHNELVELLKTNDKLFLLLYKAGSEMSDCALKGLSQAAKEELETTIIAADVTIVRDIHPNYKVSSAPSVLIFENGKFKNIVKGCNEANFYTNLLKSAFFVSTSNESDENYQKPVTVYSTPTCSWCTTLKNYLNDKNIRYTDIDVSGDHNAAKEMVRRSGQQGVPQTDIGGQMVIGFDKATINRLLNIQ